MSDRPLQEVIAKLHEQTYTAAVYSDASPYSDLAVQTRSAIRQTAGMLDQHALKRLRKAKGWRQSDLAERVGVEQPTVGRWERGTRTPDVPQILALARAFEVPAVELLSSDDLAALGLAPALSENVTLMWSHVDLVKRRQVVRVVETMLADTNDQHVGT